VFKSTQVTHTTNTQTHNKEETHTDTHQRGNNGCRRRLKSTQVTHTTNTHRHTTTRKPPKKTDGVNGGGGLAYSSEACEVDGVNGKVLRGASPKETGEIAGLVVRAGCPC